MAVTRTWRFGIERVSTTFESGDIQGLVEQEILLSISSSGTSNPKSFPPSVTTERATSNAVSSFAEVTNARTDSRASVLNLS